MDPVQCANQPQIRDAYQPGFLVTYNATAEVDLYRVYHDAMAVPHRPFLSRAGQASITVNANGQDSRGIVIDRSERDACEQACAAVPAPTYLGNLQCLAGCTDTPLRAFIANRSPPSLLFGRVRTVVTDQLATDPSCTPVCGSCTDRTTCCSGSCQDGVCVPPGSYDVVEVFGQTSLAVGPSKVALGAAIQPTPMTDAGATSRQYVFAVTFDSRFVFMYDPEAQRVVQVIRTGRGPHAIAFDGCVPGGGPGMKACGPQEAPYAYLYVAHFTDSYLGVVDLDMRHPETFGTMFASVGTPLPPLESK
jgi:hypothetical protein